VSCPSLALASAAVIGSAVSIGDTQPLRLQVQQQSSALIVVQVGCFDGLNDRAKCALNSATLSGSIAELIACNWVMR